MPLERLDELDELLRVINKSGLCRADSSAFPGQGPRSNAIPISAKKNRLEDTRSRHHLHDRCAPGK